MTLSNQGPAGASARKASTALLRLHRTLERSVHKALSRHLLSGMLAGSVSFHEPRENLMSQACYDVVVPDKTAPSLTLKAGDQPIRLPIQLDGALVDMRSILTYDFHASNPSDLKYHVRIYDGSNVQRWQNIHTLNSNDARVFQEVIPQNVLSTEGNRLEIRVESGTGELNISSVVFWYRT